MGVIDEFSLIVFFLILTKINYETVNANVMARESSVKLDIRNHLDMILTDELNSEAEEKLFHEYVSNTGIGNREVLYLASVKEIAFNYGTGVFQWYSLSKNEKLYLLGLAEKKLITVTGSQQILQNNQTLSLMQGETDIPANPIMASMAEWWNTTAKRTEVICIVAFNNSAKDFVWYRFNDGLLEMLHSLQYPSSVNYLMLTYVGLQLKLIVSDVDSSVKVYDIKVANSEKTFNWNQSRKNVDFALNQIIDLQVQSCSLAVCSIGDSVYLFIAQHELGTVLIYKTKSSTNLETITHFVRSSPDNFTSLGVKDLSTFVIGHQNYIAVSGEEPNLYKIKPNGELVKDLKDNLGSPWFNVKLGAVEKWIPLNVNTYRDDILLLAHERNADAIKFFTWRGTVSGFIQLSDSPCNLDDGSSVQDHASVCHLDIWFGRCTHFLLGPLSSSFSTLLVPYKDGTSKLFYFITHLLPQDNPVILEINKLSVRKSFLEETWENQKENLTELENRKIVMFKYSTENVMADKENITTEQNLGKNLTHENMNENFTVSPNATLMSEDGISNKMEQIRLTIEMIRSELDKRNDIGDRLRNFGKASGYVTVNGKTFVKNAEFTGKLNETSVDDLLFDTFRLDRPKKIKGRKTISTLKADKISFTKINNISSSDLVFKDVPVVIEGNLTLKKNVVVNGDIVLDSGGKVNGIDLSKNVLKFDNKLEGPLKFDTLEAMDVFVETVNGQDLSSVKREIDFSEKLWRNICAGQNLTVNKINGRDWKSLIESVVWLNENSYVTGMTTVNGKIITSGDVYYGTLNEYDYNMNTDYSYNGYGRNDEDLQSTTKDSDSPDNENEKYTTEFIPTKRSRYVDESLSNKKETKLIKGDVIARDVVIGGILSTKMKNKEKWVDDLKDIVYKTESEPVVIYGEKTFPNGIEINSTLSLSGLVNNHNVADFLTVDSDQIIKGVKKFNKIVSFENLTVVGMWDGVNVTDISLKLSNKYKTLPSLSLIKYESSDSIYKNVNATTEGYADYSTQADDVDMSDAENIIYLNIHASILEVLGNITVQGLVGGKNPTTYKTLYDLSVNDNITNDITIPKASIGSLSADIINYLHRPDIEENNDCQPFIMPKEIEDVEIHELVIEGNIKTTNGVSGYNITDINESAIGLEANKFVDGEMVFEDEVECEILDARGFINNGLIDFKSISDDIVRKTDKNIIISGKKTFASYLYINDDLQLESINDIQVSDILTKQGNQTITGKLNIQGKMYVRDELQVKGYLNNNNYTYLFSHYNYLGDGKHHWNGDLKFNKPVDVNNLFVSGLVNDVNFTTFTKNACTKDLLEENEIMFSGAKAFKKMVTINGDLKVMNNFNDIDINTFLEDVVLNNQPSTIKETITFNQKIIFSDGLNVDHDMNVPVVYGCDLKELSQNAIYLNKSDVILGSLIFESATSGGNIQSSFVNDIDLGQAFFLNKKQTIFNTLHFDKITALNDIPVGHLVNGLLLENEYNNTFLVGSDQIIDSKFFVNGNIVIKGDLVTNNTVNDKLIQNVAKLKDDNTFSGSVMFECINLNGKLVTKSNILSGFDTQDWEKRAVLKDNDQNISAEWNVKGNIIFNFLDGNGKVNNFDLTSLNNELILWKAKQLQLQYTIKNNYSRDCNEVDSMVKTASSQLYELQNFAVSQNLSYEDGINNIHLLKVHEEYFLVISSYTSCKLSFYKWNKTIEQFEKHFDQTGFNFVSKIISIEYNGETFFITKFTTFKDQQKQNCSYNLGIVLWMYSTEKLQLHFIQKLHDEDDIQLSQQTTIMKTGKSGNNHKNGTFYTLNKECAYEWKIGTERNGNYLAHKKCLKNHYHGLTPSQLIGKLNIDQPFHPIINTTNNSSIITEYTINSRTKYVAVAAIEYPELPSRTDFVKIYKSDGFLYHKMVALKPRSLNWLDVRQQSWISFIENGTSLQVYQLDDNKTGFVNRLSYNSTSINLITGALPVANKLNSMPFIILQTSVNSIYIVKGNMAGDPYSGSVPDCDIGKGIS